MLFIAIIAVVEFSTVTTAAVFLEFAVEAFAVAVEIFIRATFGRIFVVARIAVQITLLQTKLVHLSGHNFHFDFSSFLFRKALSFLDGEALAAHVIALMHEEVDVVIFFGRDDFLSLVVHHVGDDFRGGVDVNHAHLIVGAGVANGAQNADGQNFD